MLRCTPPHHMDQVNARLECAHHPSCGLVEHPSGDMIKQMTLELKVNEEVYVCLVIGLRECPRVRQVLQRPSFDGAHQHLSRSIQRNLTGKTFLEWTEPDDEVGQDLALVCAVDTCAAAPGDEQGIVLYVRNDSEELIGTVSERRLLLVMRHVEPPGLPNLAADDPSVVGQPSQIWHVASAWKLPSLQRRGAWAAGAFRLPFRFLPDRPRCGTIRRNTGGRSDGRPGGARRYRGDAAGRRCLRHRDRRRADRGGRRAGRGAGGGGRTGAVPRWRAARS